ncbi:lipocalin family protein [Rhodospira trueperi]|uniref:Outer membrane lipoprotein Blc n=1 Tax=Rhodospira trueperi TaxID=69960 RepID=A0A1G7GFC9_9PROT|nr:lipocalin family protein [Rhodospira trueperi]SDE86834.1 apolipoprotein D and lipocalin family protein [Rhodospira trueperi]
MNIDKGRARWLPRLNPLALLGGLLALAGCTGLPSGLTAVRDFDVTRFYGTWYSIMRLDHSFERGMTNVRATYQPRDDGTVAVLNRGWNPRTCRWSTISGTARFREGPDVASFGVTLGAPIEGGLHIIALDTEDYQWALASGPTRGYLWILSRTPTMPDEQRHALMRRARDFGFPVENLVRVDQSDPPVCERG